MSDYMIELCETLEALTGFDFDAIQDAILRHDMLDLWHDKTNLPNPGSKRDMRNLAKWVTVCLH